MRNYTLCLLAVLCLAFAPAHAQTTGKLDRSAIAAKVIGIDYGTLNDADLNTTAGLEIAYRYLLTKNIGLAVPLKIGVADVKGDLQNRNITSFDALLHLYPFGGEQKIKPYLLGGIGYVIENTDGGNTQIPAGLGINFRLGSNSYLNVQGEYRSSNAVDRDNLQLGLGYLYQFGLKDTDGDGVADGEDGCPELFGPLATGGCPDTDNDGVANREDACPETPGPAATMGCPDTDADGIVDTKDDCPEVAGLAAFNGCPDTDEDGITDADDACPELAGPKEWDGCPDTDDDGVHDGNDNCPNEAGIAANLGCPGSDRDKDGILDDEDECPDVAGTAATQGCPDKDGDGVRNRDDRCPDRPGTFSGCPDTDDDGVHDGDDRCPEEPGLAENKGCPEIEEEVKEVLNLAMRAVQFETGSSVIKTESYAILDQIASILKRYPAYQLRIAGHTDNVGDARRNQELSEGRASACYEYLVSKGARTTRMTHDGYGEDYPIAPNTTSAGRTLNRRVEFDLIIQ